MNIRELASSEIMQIDGAGWRSNMAEFVDTGSVIGTVIGYAATGTLIGAGRGGLIGAAGGFSAGLGWGIGTYISRRLMDSPTIQ
ncbi:glycine zipper family protein [Xylella fastidiosa]|uniref:glycine zipper family protein n=1 Tax=Xylella fastidiosa TaxID=2371 RepID=UPI0003D37E47|nr:glycine zipper family protein [Xylella fastidiosa]ALQ95282.1 membrane protein [Xylella fastidiosa]ALQ96737.1 glycine zipper family protein [Xylella fastidiosa]ALR02385.1 membrane protein [Xylella fastidiosa]ALR03974.1 glycine zipper family protein [Xylella fastidiosa]ALR08883.2 hypothetical protein XFFB_06325 [Xylella fastidiosa]